MLEIIIMTWNYNDLESQVRILLMDSYFTNMLVQQAFQITELKF